jgi:hypothetical protein
MKLVEEFKAALKLRVEDSDLRYLYEKLLFGIFMSEEDLNDVLTYQMSQYKYHPDCWFTMFHKEIRQTDFFEGNYVKVTNSMTDAEAKRRNEILKSRSDFRKKNPNLVNKSEQPHTDELRTLNSLMTTLVEVPVAGLMSGFLHSIICLDNKGELKNAMEITFKICS